MEITNVVKQQLEEKARSLKWEVEKAIDEKLRSTISQLEEMAKISVPADILDLYMKNDGKLWVSHPVYFGEDYQLSVNKGGRNLLYPESHSRTADFALPEGLYKLVIMAIPQQDDTSNKTDGYGFSIHR